VHRHEDRADRHGVMGQRMGGRLLDAGHDLAGAAAVRATA
jgi:3-hydroxyisobutyrate dehydrogenase-like beta-hydroxyacid dehydrogenase